MRPRSSMACCTWQVSERLVQMVRFSRMKQLCHLKTSSNSVSFTPNALDTPSMDTPQVLSALLDHLARVSLQVLVWPSHPNGNRPNTVGQGLKISSISISMRLLVMVALWRVAQQRLRLWLDTCSS